MRYGTPYQGSKNGIAEYVISQLPRSDTLADLFCGGCAITHAALLSGKWNNFIANDINGMSNFFYDCIQGKYTVQNHTEWVSREDFERLKGTDIYTSIVWSFSNNRLNYLYGRDIEDQKRALHNAVFFNDITELKQYVPGIKQSDKKTVEGRYTDYKIQALDRCKIFESLQSLQSLQRLQRLQSLQSDYEAAYDFAKDRYNDITVYCDIPYNNTDCKSYNGFDHSRFYKWAYDADNIYISEYTMPEGFICIAEKEKPVLCDIDGATKKTTERIFTNERTYFKLSDQKRLYYAFNFAKQMTLFD